MVMSVRVSVLNRDSDVELQRRQNNNMDVEHAFNTRRQISDHDENSTRESPEVIFNFFKTNLHLFYYVLLILCYCVLFTLTFFSVMFWRMINDKSEFTHSEHFQITAYLVKTLQLTTSDIFSVFLQIFCNFPACNCFG